MSDPTKVHVHTSDDGPCGYCSGDDCPMRYCPGCPPGCALAEDEPSGDDCSMRYCPACHGSGTELSGTTHAGLAEQLPCDDCGPDCPQDCGCRVDAEPECPESVEHAALGATNSPSGYPSDPPPLKGPQNRVERVSDAEAAEWAALADAGSTRRCQMPKPEHIEALARALVPGAWDDNSDGLKSDLRRAALRAMGDRVFAAIVTDPPAQDAVLAALVEGGRLVEQEELVPCPSRHYERDMFGEWCDESCRRFAGHDGDHECVEGRAWPRSESDPRRRVRFVEPEWREATP